MELHPILDKCDRPNSGLWYVLSTVGDSPSARVGHTCTHMGDHGAGKVYVIGGANPSGPFAETLILDLSTRSWDASAAPGFPARYEHATFVTRARPTDIYVFGGARQTGNLNDLYVYDTVTDCWSPVSTTGTAPSPRTYHSSHALATGDRFIVYSGGESGSEPVGDRQVHCLDVTARNWTTLTVRGESPKPRHGHLVVAVDERVFVHGGMAGSTFYADLHVLDLAHGTWTPVKRGSGRGWPSARAAHAAVVMGTDIYVFGGMNRDGAIDDLYKLDTKTMKWTQVDLDGPPPACRLDLGCCVAKLEVPASQTNGCDATVGQLAKDVLDQHLLRDSSASSVRSQGRASAGSGQSRASAGSRQSVGDSNIYGGENVLPNDLVMAAGDASNSVEAPSYPAVSVIDVHMLLIVGGMDTEGEMFDDCLVTLLREDSSDTQANRTDDSADG